MADRQGLISCLEVIVLAAVLVGGATAKSYTVGGGSGWQIPPSPTTYKTWASQYTFQIGDSLVFNWIPTHTVVQVNEADYSACTSTNPISPVHTTSPASFTLTANGTTYYICTVSEHCSLAMKLAVTVVESVSPPTSAPPPPSSAPPARTPPPSAAPPARTPPPPSAAPPTPTPPPSTAPPAPTPPPSTAPPAPTPPPSAPHPSAPSSTPLLSPTKPPAPEPSSSPPPPTSPPLAPTPPPPPPSSAPSLATGVFSATLLALTICLMNYM